MTMLDNATAQRMLDWLPPIWYSRAFVVHALLTSEAEQIDQGSGDVALVREARLPQTASEWAIGRLETECDLAVQPDTALQDRRDRVRAHFRGLGATQYRLRAIAKSWGYGEVIIVADPNAFMLHITFTDPAGLPVLVEDLKTEMRDNVPAHVDIIWDTHYLVWGEPKRLGITWGQLKAAGRKWGDMKLMKPGDLP